MQELRVHHTTSDGLLLQLEAGGYGRMTVAELGGDALAEKMLAHFARQPSVPAIPTDATDATGYAVCRLSLADLSSDAQCIADRRTAALLALLFRKTAIAGFGAPASGRVVKQHAAGCILRLSNGLSAVTLGALPTDGDGSAADDDDDDAPAGRHTVRVLYYETTAGLATCAADKAVVARAPERPDDALIAAWHYGVGTVVEGTVLLLCKEPALGTTVAVCEVAAPGAAATTLVYAEVRGDAGLAVGAEVALRLTFVPGPALASALPFAVAALTHSDAGAAPMIRRRLATSAAPLLHFPWRAVKTARSDDADDETDAPRQRRRQLEEELDRFERQGQTVPTTADGFEKLLLATPRSSFLWTQYMAFLVGVHRVDEARTVAEKSLRVIPATESAELLNVWVAYLNLENLHGTAESLTAVFRRALQHADEPRVVHEKLADIFAATGKKEQLLQLCRTMTGKYRGNPKVWERLGCALVDTNKRDQLKRFMKDMANGGLGKVEQCIVVEHIAIHEYRRGQPEHGRALFEGLVARMPKKSDVWGAYVDQELGLIARSAPEASVPGTRAVFDRVSTQALPPKAMQRFLTRFLEFEQAHGAQPDVDKVKAKAKAYVEARIAPTV